LPSNREEIEEQLRNTPIERTYYFFTQDIHAMMTLNRYSSLVITPDTSIVHLASAEGKPVIAFYLTAGEWLPFRIPSYVILPKKGDAINTIPFAIVKNGVDVMVSEDHEANPYITRIVRCENPSIVEIRK
jgi:ADP-heptose:LPS heptosyltransferase